MSDLLREAKKSHGKVHHIVAEYERMKTAFAVLDDSINNILKEHTLLLNKIMEDEDGK